MLKKLLSGSKTPKFARYQKLKSEFETSQGDANAAAAEYSLEVQSGLAMAKQQWVKSPSIDTARALHERMVQSESLSKLNLTFMAVEHRTNAVNAFNRANLPLVREALLERVSVIAEVVNQKRAEVVPQYYRNQDDADAHEPLASLLSRFKEVNRTINEIDATVHPTSAYIDSWITVLERPLDLEQLPAQPAPKPSLGIFESYNAQMHELPSFIPEKTHEESIAESQLAYLGDAETVPASEMVEMPGVGVVRRRRPEPPVFLEPRIEDGKVVGMKPSELQPA